MAAQSSSSSERFREIRNRKAGRDYTIEDKYEAGIQLTGTEVKSLRNGRAEISDAFVRVMKGVPILYNARIDAYVHGNIHNHEPTRPRNLLLHKKEIQKITMALEAEGCTLFPLRLYFKKGLAKLEIAVGKGKKLYDKRQDMKKKVALREVERALKHR